MAKLKLDDDWEQKVRYGKLLTPHRHYTVILDGDVQQKTERNRTAMGPAIMGFKCWASSHEEAFEMAALFAKEFSFTITSRLQLKETDPAKQPCSIPFGYDFHLIPHSTGSAFAG